MLYKERYNIKRVDGSDFIAIKELFWKVFKKRVSVDYLTNKYNTSFLGIDFICSIAYCDNIPVAFYGALPQLFENGKDKIYVAHACDSYTLPEHQRQGLHYQLAIFAYDIMKSYDIKFVYAFHSENTYQSTKKLHWKEHKNLKRFHINTYTLPLGKVLNKITISKIYSLFFRKRVTASQIKKLKKDNQDKFQLELSKNFIDYKNTFNDHYSFEADGCVFWFKIQAIIHIGKFYAPSEQAFKKAIKKLKRKARFLGITELLFQVDTNSKMITYLNTISQPQQSWLVGYLDFDPSVNLSDFSFSYLDLDTF